MNTINELVINWHITEACNYDCGYCFAKWGKPNEIHNSPKVLRELLSKLAQYFLNGSNTINNLKYSTVRINFAGGEPTLLRTKLVDAIIYAKELGFKTSLITNGTLLVNKKVEIPKDTLDMLGFSFDSSQLSIQEEIGRVARNGVGISLQDVKKLFDDLRQTQSNLVLKLNTVVNKFNWTDNFSEVISLLQPDKWKIFKALPFDGHELTVNDFQFDSFRLRHRNFITNFFAEDNSAMTESYLMLDPLGRFYQNTEELSDYRYSSEILKVGVSKALEEIRFDPVKFAARYASQSIALNERGAANA